VWTADKSVILVCAKHVRVVITFSSLIARLMNARRRARELLFSSKREFAALRLFRDSHQCDEKNVVSRCLYANLDMEKLFKILFRLFD